MKVTWFSIIRKNRRWFKASNIMLIGLILINILYNFFYIKAVKNTQCFNRWKRLNTNPTEFLIPRIITAVPNFCFRIPRSRGPPNECCSHGSRRCSPWSRVLEAAVLPSHERERRRNWWRRCFWLCHAFLHLCVEGEWECVRVWPCVISCSVICTSHFSFTSEITPLLLSPVPNITPLVGTLLTG